MHARRTLEIIGDELHVVVVVVGVRVFFFFFK